MSAKKPTVDELTARVAALEADCRALKESGDLYRTLFRGAAEGVLVADVETKQFRHVNPAACRMFGYAAEEFARLTVRDLHPRESIEGVFAEFDAQAAGEKTLAAEVPCLRKDGSVVFADINTTPTRIDGRPCNVGFFHEVTDRKEAEEEILRLNRDLERRVAERTAELESANQALRESEERYRTLAENAPDIITMVDRDGIIRYVNRLVPRLPAEAVIGRSAFELLPPEAHEGVRSDLRRVFDRGETVHREMIAPNLPEPRWYTSRAAPLRRGAEVVGAIIISTDVTERKRTEDALRESEQRYRRVVEDQTELICRFLPDGTLTFVNGAYCRYFDKEPEELIGKSFMPLIPEEDRGKDQDLLASLTRERPTGTIEHRVVAPDGEIRWHQWTNRKLFDRAGELIELQAVGRDVTERNRLQQRLIGAARMASVGILALSVSHELNNMLGGLRGLAELSEKDAELVPRLIGACRAVAERGGAIAGRMTSISRADAAGAERRIDVASVVRTVVNMMRPSLAPRNIAVQESYKPVPLTWINEGNVLQILLNLIANARDAIGRDGTVRVSVAADTESGPIRIAVADTGPGIPATDLGRIFDPFFTTRREPGPEGGEPSHLGLGLAESLRIARQYGGAIDAQSEPEPGCGAVFTVRLPLRSAPTTAIPARPPAHALPARGAAMLVVDDDELTRLVLVEHLADLGYEVVEVKGGREARRVSAERAFDYVFLDMLMPGELDGATAFREIRAALPDAKIIISTAFSRENIPEECLADAFAMLAKPFGKEDLLAALAGENK